MKGSGSTTNTMDKEPKTTQMVTCIKDSGFKINTMGMDSLFKSLLKLFIMDNGKCIHKLVKAQKPCQMVQFIKECLKMV